MVETRQFLRHVIVERCDDRRELIRPMERIGDWMGKAGGDGSPDFDIALSVRLQGPLADPVSECAATRISPESADLKRAAPVIFCDCDLLQTNVPFAAHFSAAPISSASSIITPPLAVAISL
jgi:hypothetical protein